MAAKPVLSNLQERLIIVRFMKSLVRVFQEYIKEDYEDDNILEAYRMGSEKNLDGWGGGRFGEDENERI